MLPLKSTKNKLIITATITVLLLIGYIMIFSTISSTNKALSELDYELNKEVHTETQLKSLNDIIKDTTEERLTLDSYFISTDGVVDFINNLEIYARSVGASPEIISVNIKESILPWAGERFETLNLEIKIEGEWEEVFHFATLIDRMPSYVQVNRASIENIPIKEEEGSSEAWNGIFNIDVLKRK